MATVLRRTDVGVDIRAFGSSWQIAGVSVDNPSGSWLRIPNIGDVPPYTLGWSMPINPKAASIDVLFVASPSGTPSELVGNPVTVTISDVSLPTNPGVASGADQSQSPRGTFVVTARQQMIATETPSAVTPAFDPGSNVRFVPLTMAYMFIPPNLAGSTSVGMRGGVTIETISNLLVILPTVTLTPEYPMIVQHFPPGFKLGLGDIIDFRVQSWPGCGAQAVNMFLTTYRQLT